MENLPIFGIVAGIEKPPRLEANSLIPWWIGQFLCTRNAVKQKLVSKEDPQYLHKFLGGSCLLSWAYRYGYCYNKYGNLNFEGTWFDHFTMILHMALSSSSLIFAVLPQRLLKRPLIIYEEYRLHAIFFTYRALTVYLLGYFMPFEGTSLNRLMHLPAVMIIHFITDEITRRHGPNDPTLTTVRID